MSRIDASHIFRPLIVQTPGQPDPTSGDAADLQGSARPLKAGDLVRLTRTGSSMTWVVRGIDPHRGALIDLPRGSLLGPQWEHLTNLEVIQ
jgi:hypothetical protein